MLGIIAIAIEMLNNLKNEFYFVPYNPPPMLYKEIIEFLCIRSGDANFGELPI